MLLLCYQIKKIEAVSRKVYGLVMLNADKGKEVLLQLKKLDVLPFYCEVCVMYL